MEAFVIVALLDEIDNDRFISYIPLGLNPHFTEALPQATRLIPVLFSMLMSFPRADAMVATRAYMQDLLLLTTPLLLLKSSRRSHE